ncbi:MAG TPA: citrate synthase/methylcitrate synthase [Thermoanaerobaculia bacterium]|nr:citrate synthase/methylcitrate synthase [Thermoanaerobaculia bacterium]
MTTNTLYPGLEGIVAAETALSMVDGEAGELVIAGFPVSELALNATFEETVVLLWSGSVPEAAALDRFRSALAERRALRPEILDLLAAAARAGAPPMDALRAAAGAVSLGATPVPADLFPAAGIRDDDRSYALALVAAFPTIVAVYARIAAGKAPLAPRPDLGHAANFLYMLDGQTPAHARVRGLETYLNTVVDHGLNASTFAARVIASTDSDLVSAIAGAAGALKGPLHGGAPGPALDMVFEIGEASRAESYLRKKIEAGEKLMGFGHRVYKVRDPRADVLAAAAARMYLDGGDMKLYELARSVEATALRLLEEYKPGRRLQTNVEFYTALLLHGLGLDVPLFTPVFAISRVAGWIAHCFEQRRANRLIRPQSVYVGPRGRKWRRS